MRFAIAALLLTASFPVMAFGEEAVAEPGVDCPKGVHCPVMIKIPASPAHFKIGSPESEADRQYSEKQHEVAIKPFAMGKYEVRVAEYMDCVAAKACRPPEWLEPGGEHNIETGQGVTYKSIVSSIKGDDQPIVGVSWDDAAAYAAWLSKETGAHYRLPSEAEWEYAARAGSTTAYWWGNNVKKGDEVMACCQGCGSEKDGDGFFPVASFKPNNFGLHNTAGNVWEWVEDYYCDDYATGPSDGGARQSKSCSKQESPEGLRVFRGGSCFFGAMQLRSAMRLRNWPHFRNQTIGFRLARDLTP